MKVWILSLEHPNQPLSADGPDLHYEETTGAFSMPRPLGDDWLQRIVHVPEPRPELVNQAQQQTVVIFKLQEDAAKFLAWLMAANDEAGRPFRNVRD